MDPSELGYIEVATQQMFCKFRQLPLLNLLYMCLFVIVPCVLVRGKTMSFHKQVH